MSIAVEDTRKSSAPRSSYDIKRRSKAAQIDIGHQFEVFVPIPRFGTDGVHLLGSVNQIRILCCSIAAGVLGLSRDTESANCNQ